MIKIYNSLTNKLEEFKSIKENELSMYVCGPTVYNHLHVGNSRPVIFFDVVARFFKYIGYKVTYVSNYTDIDDKIIKKAKQENVTETEISEKYIKIVANLYRKLNCLPHDKNPKVTENMESIIDFIARMVEVGGAYVSDGDVYFDVAKVSKYGVLSGQSIDNLINGARIEPNEKKHNVIDFTLWKKTLEGIKWNSPWGEGRPGWHTECVVMIDNIFGGKIDIHGGGNDLKFPHHDNEIAQSVCVNNHMIANYWIHNGRVDLAGEKMSKSLGNVIWAEDLLDSTTYQIYRLMMLNVPYRQSLIYKDELLKQSQNDFEKIKRVLISAYRKLELSSSKNYLVNDKDLNCRYISNDTDYENSELNNLLDEFIAHMSNDFNTPNAITTIFKLTKSLNAMLRDSKTSEDKLYDYLNVLYNMLWVLGIDYRVEPLTEEDRKLVTDWYQAKADKNFTLADELREKINLKNIQL